MNILQGACDAKSNGMNTFHPKYPPGGGGYPREPPSPEVQT
jgi:hypothetical protein